MSTIDGAVRRQRILKAREDRLALITGRLHILPSSPPQSLSPDADGNFTGQSPPLVSRNCVPEPRPSRRPKELYLQFRITYVLTRDKLEAAQPNQNGAFASGSREEYFLQRDEAVNEAWSLSCPEQLIPILLNLFGSISSKQLSFVLAATEQPRTLFSITMALLVLLSHFRFLIFGSKIIRSIILFRPLIFLLLTNTALIGLRILPEMKGKEKAGHKSTVLDVCGGNWVEEAGRVVEVGLMVHDVLKTLFMDFIVYCSIIICGFCLVS